MTGQSRPDRRRIGGFTLLELLIAVSLLGLIFAALTGGLRFGTVAWQTTAQRLEQSDDLHLVYHTLRRQISTALNAPANPVSNQPTSSFEGLGDQVSFVGAAPARAMKPGLFRLTLALEPDADSNALALRWERLDKTAADATADNIEPVLRGLRSIQFSYYGARDSGDSARWIDEWRDNRLSPRLVRISVEFADPQRAPWPAIVIPLYAQSG